MPNQNTLHPVVRSESMNEHAPLLASTLRPVSADLCADKEALTLDEIRACLPTPSLPASAQAVDEYLDALYALGRRTHTPNISPSNVRWLQALLCTHQPQRILEIGCANGYSSLRMWQVAQAWGAKLLTMDVSAPTVLEARQHCAALGANIDVRLGNALSILPSLMASQADPFDFIFIDAQKALTLDFFVRARKLAHADAWIVIDDVVKFRSKMTNFYDYLHIHSIEYEIHELPDDEDGVMLIAPASFARSE